MAEQKRASPRVREHVNRLLHAGFDTQKFFDALVSIRDDATLPKAGREALFKLLAMESFIWYLEALRHEPIDRMTLLMEAKRIQDEHEAAIRTSTPGEKAAELAQANISAPKEPPPPRPSVPPAITKNERPPKK